MKYLFLVGFFGDCDRLSSTCVQHAKTFSKHLQKCKWWSIATSRGYAAEHLRWRAAPLSFDACFPELLRIST